MSEKTKSVYEGIFADGKGNKLNFWQRLKVRIKVAVNMSTLEIGKDIIHNVKHSIGLRDADSPISNEFRNVVNKLAEKNSSEYKRLQEVDKTFKKNDQKVLSLLSFKERFRENIHRIKHKNEIEGYDQPHTKEYFDAKRKLEESKVIDHAGTQQSEIGRNSSSFTPPLVPKKRTVSVDKGGRRGK